MNAVRTYVHVLIKLYVYTQLKGFTDCILSNIILNTAFSCYYVYLIFYYVYN